jgi:hypothetical protein
MSPLASAEGMALCGIAFVSLFAVWEMQVAPRLARRFQGAPNV